MNRCISHIATGGSVKFIKGRCFLTPPIQTPIGAFSISFYRLQYKYMKQQMNLQHSFQWNHPSQIQTDRYGVIWYYDTTQHIWWKPGVLDLEPKYDLRETSYIMIKTS